MNQPSSYAPRFYSLKANARGILLRMNRLNAKKKKKTIKLPKTESHTLKAVEVKMKRTGIICIEKRKKKKAIVL